MHDGAGDGGRGRAGPSRAGASSRAASGEGAAEHRAGGPGGHGVDPDAVGTEVAGEVADGAAERRLRDAEPVQARPGAGGVAVQRDDRGARRRAAAARAVHQRGSDQADVRRTVPATLPRLRRPGRRAVGLGQVGDGVQDAVDAVPARRAHGVRQRGEVVGELDVELEHLARDAQPRRDPGGDAVRPADRRGEQHVGALGEGEPGDGAGQRGLGEHAGDEQPPAREQAGHAQQPRSRGLAGDQVDERPDGGGLRDLVLGQARSPSASSSAMQYSTRASESTGEVAEGRVLAQLVRLEVEQVDGGAADDVEDLRRCARIGARA